MLELDRVVCDCDGARADTRPIQQAQSGLSSQKLRIGTGKWEEGKARSRQVVARTLCNRTVGLSDVNLAWLHLNPVMIVRRRGGRETLFDGPSRSLPFKRCASALCVVVCVGVKKVSWRWANLLTARWSIDLHTSEVVTK